MDIQVWSDVICPWCYIGKRRLEKALAEFGGDVTVTYRAYQLDASPVPQPLPIKKVMAEKFGGAERAEQMFAHVAGIGTSEGLTLDFDRAIAANTFAAHRLIAWAAGQDRQADMLDALQRAHFTDGVDIGSLPALAEVAGSIGLDPAAALAYLESEAGTGAVQADITEARELDITSVPTFVIDGKYAVQGAQEASSLIAAFEEIARREAVDAGL
ncbi:putative DsbA family dithiol-disulfide isomerase [Actinoplanes octamycinicus]|uniref:Putative DsbA family dithiol-disulfide isomerase n=1 Tax=Actinoplanes octamycinicus TaxID=135948 RepID=A0A7W7GTS1_9ACTN|nr:DsbA family oxidoreductase [Actinoplanes octamycinicus]MBB4738144.1 putative DsbA family dithiol-disulfide isomerase [Actinoplanes octamycinicus]GIE59297.1 polyketide synthase [Actinoplanes octamycinicus]